MRRDVVETLSKTCACCMSRCCSGDVQVKCPDIKKACPGNKAITIVTRFANPASQFKAKQKDYIAGVANAAAVSPQQVVITQIKYLYTLSPKEKEQITDAPPEPEPAPKPAGNATAPAAGNATAPAAKNTTAPAAGNATAPTAGNATAPTKPAANATLPAAAKAEAPATNASAAAAGVNATKPARPAPKVADEAGPKPQGPEAAQKGPEPAKPAAPVSGTVCVCVLCYMQQWYEINDVMRHTANKRDTVA